MFCEICDRISRSLALGNMRDKYNGRNEGSCEEGEEGHSCTMRTMTQITA